MATMEPGQLIVPHGPEDSKSPSDGSPEPQRPAEQPVNTPAPAPKPTPEPNTVTVAPPTTIDQSRVVSEPAPDQPWHYSQSNDMPSAQSPVPTGLNWTASEFIHHEKSAGWYGVVIVSGIVAAGLIYLLTKDKITTSIIVLAVLAFAGYAAKSKPRVQQYALNSYGLSIGNKAYAFQDFKTFSITEEGAIASIVFMPLKRFMPPLTIYLSPEIEEQVVDYLSAFLPFEERKPDTVDSFMRRIRF